jgi:NAD(P)-dependent dehydrogenase (short-subunit alcohol dehydrogenase family)
MLKNKTIIVTGASSGIGEAIARRLARAGANVVVFARRAERLATLCAELGASNTRTLAVAGDVTVAADRERLVRATLEKFGRIDALVNNAGYGQRGPLERIPLEALRANFETNVFSLVALTQLIAPLMRVQGAGRIVNIGSVAGRITRPLSSAYDSTKFALEGITDGLRGELKPFGVQVVLVRPGFIRTEFGQTAEAVSAPTLSPDGAGAYAPYVNYFEANRAKLRRVAGVPDDIARLVEKALAARRPRRCHNGPLHAKLFLFLKWLLPARVFDWALRMKRE